ncbi:MAG: hypothetical protein ACR2NM_15380, partial [Bythopirellula sp.]
VHADRVRTMVWGAVNERDSTASEDGAVVKPRRVGTVVAVDLAEAAAGVGDENLCRVGNLTGQNARG